MDSSASLPTLGSSNLPAPRTFSPEDEAQLREALKRCPPATLAAACAFRRTGDLSQVPAIVLGIIERYVESGLRSRLQQPAESLRLVEDLGIDSLTMMEIVILAEDVLQVTVNNDELRGLVTLADVRQFLACKLAGVPWTSEPRQLAS